MAIKSFLHTYIFGVHPQVRSTPHLGPLKYQCLIKKSNWIMSVLSMCPHWVPFFHYGDCMVLPFVHVPPPLGACMQPKAPQKNIHGETMNYPYHRRSELVSCFYLPFNTRDLDSHQEANFCIWTYLSFIWHKSLDIGCNMDSIFFYFSRFDTGISSKDPKLI